MGDDRSCGRPECHCFPRVLSPWQGLDAVIVQSVVPKVQFEALQGWGAISGLRRWPGFGGDHEFGEYVLRQPDVVQLLNVGMRS